MKRPVWVVGFSIGAGLALLSGQILAQTSNEALIASGTEFATGLLPSTIATTDTGAATSPVANAPGASNLSATSVVPNYTANSASLTPSTATGTNLMTMGVSEINRCANYKPTGDPVADQQCAGVNYLANRNPAGQYIIQSNDPMLQSQTQAVAGATDTTSPGATCKTITTTIPGTFETVQCSESAIPVQISCLKTLNPLFGYATEPFTVNDGPYVPPWSAGTFQHPVFIKGRPTRVMLNRYKADNYGQLWVNGRLVIQNVLGGMSDLRGGYVGYSNETACSTDENGSEYCWQYSSGPYFFNADGSKAGFYDDNCNWGCQGTNPNMDITSYFKSGQNTITMACANARDWGDCVVNISMEGYGVVQEEWIDGCQLADQASQGSGPAVATK